MDKTPRKAGALAMKSVWVKLCTEPLLGASGLKNTYVVFFLNEGKKGNFEIEEGNTLNLPYDFESIIHYGM